MTNHLNRKQAAAVLGVCVKTVDRLKAAGRLPYHRSRKTGAVTFDRAQVEALKRGA